MEHRCGARYELDLAAYARTHAGVVSSVGWLRDISVSGGFFLTQLPVQPFNNISLRLIDADGNFGPRLEGHITRRVPHGVGIEWTDYQPELIRDLTQHGRFEQTHRLSHEHFLARPELITCRHLALRTLLRNRTSAKVLRTRGVRGGRPWRRLDGFRF